jgi:hypothetical protein
VITAFLRDLRYGLRTLGRNPGFTCVAVLALTLGIGSVSAIFTVVNSVLLQPLHFYRPDQISSSQRAKPEEGIFGVPTVARQLPGFPRLEIRNGAERHARSRSRRASLHSSLPFTD